MLLLAVPRRGIVVGLSDRWGGVIEISPHPTLRHIYINGALPPSFIPFLHICHSPLSKKLNTSNKRPGHVRVQDVSINKRFYQKLKQKHLTSPLLPHCGYRCFARVSLHHFPAIRHPEIGASIPSPDLLTRPAHPLHSELCEQRRDRLPAPCGVWMCNFPPICGLLTNHVL